ncbi:MAG: DUF362 domain-containing protein [Candidatus Marinimicrobia bacterium]|nr:DUF362 domain-containing protein [Candidatus Neomarinimicrobiota bacterium]
MSGSKISRRKFIASLGVLTAGAVVNPFRRISSIYGFGKHSSLDYLTAVAVTRANSYDDYSLIKNKVQHLFESLDGISDIVSSGKKVGIKINLTGGAGFAFHDKLKGKDIGEVMWTHPAVLKAVCELIIDSGVKASDIYVLEAISRDDTSYSDFGYEYVVDKLGLNFININYKEPYDSFVEVPVGKNYYNYEKFTLNRILTEIDVYISIPKMKHHYAAGTTQSLKNQVGIAPRDIYTGEYRREVLHCGKTSPDKKEEKSYLPRSIVDLNRARPVHLAVIDGIKSANGGEGVWNPTFEPAEYHFLLAGKDPVATDSIATYIMGRNPEGEKIERPEGDECDNHLYLANQLGMGTNVLSTIELVGDGAEDVGLSICGRERVNPTEIKLHRNYPNPFNSSTIIEFYLPRDMEVKLDIYNIRGQRVVRLVDKTLYSGKYKFVWKPNGLPSGVYFAKLRAGRVVKSVKMMYLK